MGQIFFKTKKEKLATSVTSLMDCVAKDIDGVEHKLADLSKGYKSIMVVNIASKWGLTKTHYEQMVNIHGDYHDRGFQIFAFPCNQFMSQEPGTDEEIKKFAQEKYGAKFQLFSKIDVNGEDSHEVFRYLRRNSPLYDEKSDTVKNIPWNFSKFLVDSKGQVVEYYTPKQNPEVCIPKIEEMLNQD